MNYSKGGWKVVKWRDSGGLDGISIDQENNIPVAFMGWGQTEANAHLIAAAPKLYEALKLYIAHQEGTSGHYCSICHNEIEQAIAEAEKK